MPPPTGQITVDIPSSLADEDVAERVRVLLVVDAVRGERLAWREGARALGMVPGAFIDLLRQHGIAVARASPLEEEEDLATLDLTSSSANPPPQ